MATRPATTISDAVDVTGQARAHVLAREDRVLVAGERAGEAMRARALRVTRGAELDHVAARAALAIGGGLGAVVDLAERDPVIGRPSTQPSRFTTLNDVTSLL